MKGGSGSAVGNRRLAKAALLVTLAIAAAPIIDGAIYDSSVVQKTADSTACLKAESIAQSSSVEDVLARLEELANSGIAAQGAIPPAIEREVGFPPGARNIRAGTGGQVIGYVVDGEPVSVLAQLESRMNGLGWEMVPLGELDGATFLKRDGEYTWALASCTQVGSSTCVVIRLNQRGDSPLEGETPLWFNESAEGEKA